MKAALVFQFGLSIIPVPLVVAGCASEVHRRGPYPVVSDCVKAFGYPLVPDMVGTSYNGEETLDEAMEKANRSHVMTLAQQQRVRDCARKRIAAG